MTKEKALAMVAQRIIECQRCKYYPGQQAVPGEGNPNAEIMFVGEAPGKKENETGRPFVGAAGQFLDELLNSIGLEREDVFITNVIKYQPPGNRDPLPEEITFQLPFLEKQIAIIKPKLICFLGRHAMKALLPENEKPISAVHGQLVWGLKKQTIIGYRSPTRQYSSKADNSKLKNENSLQAYLPLYHPAAALYKDSMRQTLFDDFAKIPEIMDKIKNNF